MTYVSRKRIAVGVLVGFLAGILWVTGIRFALYDKDDLHYHANFAMYINGEKEEFESFAFYEEVQSCGADAAFNPRNRTHMHDEINHVVHVHDEAATWGHFFANLGFTLGDEVLSDGRTVYENNEDSKLRFLLNEKEVSTIANQTIRSEDVLLINYGEDTDETLQQRYDQITKDAAEYNLRQDPSACTGGKPVTFGERLRHAIGIN